MTLFYPFNLKLGLSNLLGLFNPATLGTLSQRLNSMPSGGEIVDSSRTGTARPIQPGRYYEFDATDDFVATPFTVASEASSFSFSFWIKFNALTISEQAIGDGAAANAFGILFSSANANVYLSGTTNNDNALRSIPFVPTNGTWHHIVLTWNGSTSTAAFYADGVNYREDVLSTVSFTDWNVIFGARRAVSTDLVINGGMFDVRFYDTALTASEVKYLATYGDIGTDPSLPTVWFKCDEAAGTVAFDSSGNGNDGTITNATLSTFHAENSTVPYSFQNEVGYSDGAAGVLIPRDESDTANDIDGNPLDYTGQVPHNGLLINSNCGDFDGTNDYVAISDPANLGAAFSLSTWVNTSASGSAQGLIAQYVTTTNNRSFRLNLSSGGVPGIYLSSDGIANSLYSGSSAVNDGAWHHLVITYNAGALSFYVDGALDDTDTATQTSIYSTSVDLTLGSGFNNGSELLNGQMFDARIYSDVLTADEVSYIYSQGASGTDPTTTNLVARYPFAEGAGTTIHDVSGNDNHGTATNITEVNFWG